MEASQYWTNDQMEVWKKAGEVIILQTTFKGETLQVALKEPDWATMKNVSSFVHRNELTSAGEVILGTCWLAGPEVAKTNAKLKLALCLAAVEAVSKDIPTWESSPLG